MSWFFNSFHAKDDESYGSSSSSECVRITPDNYSVDGFLAPPPSSTAVVAADDSAARSSSPSSSQVLRGIRNDLAEITGSLRTGLSLLSVNSHMAVGGISRFASNLLPFQSDSDDHEFEDEFMDDVPGITDEVLKFVTDVSSQPDYWTEFSMALDDSDFEMFEVHRKHISTVEQLIPEISALRLKLRSFMSDELFWMIYFVLLLEIVNQDDFELLSTPEIIEARNTILEKLQSEENEQVNSEHSIANDLVCGRQEEGIPDGEKTNSTQVIGGGGESKFYDGENINQWLENADTKEMPDGEKTNSTQVNGGGEESKLYDGENINRWLENADTKEMPALTDISFSDTEDEENDLYSKISATKPPYESCDWIQVPANFYSRKGTDSGGENLSDWSKVEAFD